MPRALILSGAGAVVLLVLLVIERRVLDARLRRIPVRVCVTGTRGKSSVTRLLAGAMRASGERVLAKTTGSRAMFILPDGSERAVPRRGLPTVLEQKRLLGLAARLGARSLVAEMMSVRPECLAVESGSLLRPQVLVVTNARLDHTDLMGRSRAEIASSLAAAFPRSGTVVIPEEEVLPVFVERARSLGTELVLARKGPGSPPFPGSGPAGVLESNSRLALETARVLGIGEDAARGGMLAANPDVGSLRAWDAPGGADERDLSFVNLFAANDPLSTRQVLDAVLARPEFSERALVGLLNLRRDRGDRSMQWAEAFEDGMFAGLAEVAVLGGPAWAFVRRMRKNRMGRDGRFRVVAERLPERIIASLASFATGPVLVVGMGNIGGSGLAVVEHCERTGEPHGL